MEKLINIFIFTAMFLASSMHSHRALSAQTCSSLFEQISNEQLQKQTRIEDLTPELLQLTEQIATFHIDTLKIKNPILRNNRLNELQNKLRELDQYLSSDSYYQVLYDIQRGVYLKDRLQQAQFREQDAIKTFIQNLESDLIKKYQADNITDALMNAYKKLPGRNKDEITKDILNIFNYPHVSKKLDFSKTKKSFWKNTIFPLTKQSIYVNTLKPLLEKLKNEVMNEHKQTLVHWAAESGYDSTIKILYELGYKIDPVDSNSITPLHLAAQLGHDSVIKILHEVGHKANISDSDGKTPVHWVQHDNHTTLKQLQELGHKIDHADKYGRTVLHKAAHLGSNSTVEFLVKELKHKIDPADNYGLTPFHLATLSGSNSTIQLLYQLGHKINPVDKKGRTPLHEAAEQKIPATIKLLNKLGHELQPIDKEGRTPLHLAASSTSLFGKNSVIDLLIQLGHKIDPVDNNGETPLQLARKNGNKRAIKILSDLGAKE